jgi:nucleotide-binding universal stress UspA family protein
VTDVAASIADHARELADPLIVMCTHGRGGLGNLLLGNIAQRVVAAGTAPVLLVPPAEGGEPPPFDCSRLLVPLAGDREHEPGLPVAGDLAGACGGTIRLLRVVRTRGTLADGVAAAGRLLPRTAAAMLEMVRQEAGEYLDARVRELQAAGLAVATEVRRGDPAGEILQAARDDGASVIVMATHRRGGMTAFWQGSVAHRVASYAKRPVLLVPLLPGL